MNSIAATYIADHCREHLVIIDASYFIFYRLYALLAWSKHKFTGNPEGYAVLRANPAANAEFVAHFVAMCRKHLQVEIPRHCGAPFSAVILAKDCPQSAIWRMAILPSYKGNRPDNTAVAPFFDIFFAEVADAHGLTYAAGRLLESPQLEADDCAALCVRSVQPAPVGPTNIVCITGDTDYLQLCRDNRVRIIDLHYKDIAVKHLPADMPREQAAVWYLVSKIWNGDTCDNIPPCCGDGKARRKCAGALAAVWAEFQADGAGDLASWRGPFNWIDAWQRNRRLISFDEIPVALRGEPYV